MCKIFPNTSCLWRTKLTGVDLGEGNCAVSLTVLQGEATCISYAPSSASCSALATHTAPSPIPTDGAPCTGDSSYCITGPLIRRCRSGVLKSEDCDNDIPDAPLGVTCVSVSPSSASCSAFNGQPATTTTTTTTSSSPIPTSGQYCRGNSGFCAGGPIIAFCNGGKVAYGNCDDNLNEPPLGATCISYAPSMASCSAFTSATDTSASLPIPTAGSSCSGNTAFCVSGPIIARCDAGTIGYGNCDDNLGEPPLGATCISYAPSSASCSAYTATSEPTPVPTPGSQCSDDSAFCVAGPIIARCDAGYLGYGNCDDNLNEPPLGATCISYAPSRASCSAYQTIGGSNGTTGLPGSSATPSNGTFPGATNTPTSPNPPVSTGAADKTRSWTGPVLVGAVALIAGGAIVL